MLNSLIKRKNLVKKTFSILSMLIALPSIIYAEAVNFVPLETSSPWAKSIDPNKPAEFFQSVFNTGLAIAATLAVVMIMYGGVKYMTTDAWNNKEEAKEIIQNAVYGLVLALVSYLILYTINPDILNVRL
jgi:hypothetical protein